MYQFRFCFHSSYGDRLNTHTNRISYTFASRWSLIWPDLCLINNISDSTTFIDSSSLLLRSFFLQRNDEIRLVIKVTAESKTDQTYDRFHRTQPTDEETQTRKNTKKKKKCHTNTNKREWEIRSVCCQPANDTIYSYMTTNGLKVREFFLISYLLSIDSFITVDMKHEKRREKKSKPVVQQVFVYRWLVVVFLVCIYSFNSVLCFGWVVSICSFSFS